MLLHREFATGTLFSITGVLLTKSFFMLRWSFMFLIIAIIAGVLGFSGIAAGAASIAKVLFFIFIGFWLVMIVLGVTIFKK
jgi:uncharacterized membrane protein YtjA (UPF0391 family)